MSCVQFSRPKPEEIHPFSQSEIDLLAVELGEYGPLVVFASETGMRPSEWRAVEWRDVDRNAGVVLVERSFAFRSIASTATWQPERRTRRGRSSMPTPDAQRQRVALSSPGD